MRQTRSRTSPKLFSKGGVQPGADTTPAQDCAPATDGFALVIVLGWLALLALLATQITLAGHTDATIAANALGSALVESAADGAVHRALFQLLTRQWQANGAEHAVAAYRAVVQVRIDDEAGKLDPNVAPSILLQALLRECGATPTGAARGARAIVEWRSVDLLQTTPVEPVNQYQAGGLRYLPPHSRFLSNDEIGLVPAITAQLLACLNPHISVYSLSVPTLQTTADPVIRQALRDAYPDDAMLPASGSGQQVTVVRITAFAREVRGAGAQFRRIAVVRVAPGAPGEDFVYKLLAWEDGGS